MVDKPSSKEEEYFLEQEAKRRKERELKELEKKKEKDRQKLKELHYMHCPKCGADLVEVSYFNIKVDRCTSCQGVWLDHGELDAITKFQEVGLFKNLFSFMGAKGKE